MTENTNVTRLPIPAITAAMITEASEKLEALQVAKDAAPSKESKSFADAIRSQRDDIKQLTLFTSLYGVGEVTETSRFFQTPSLGIKPSAYLGYPRIGYFDTKISSWASAHALEIEAEDGKGFDACETTLDTIRRINRIVMGAVELPKEGKVYDSLWEAIDTLIPPQKVGDKTSVDYTEILDIGKLYVKQCLTDILPGDVAYRMTASDIIAICDISGKWNISGSKYEYSVGSNKLFVDAVCAVFTAKTAKLTAKKGVRPTAILASEPVTNIENSTPNPDDILPSLEEMTA